MSEIQQEQYPFNPGDEVFMGHYFCVRLKKDSSIYHNESIQKEIRSCEDDGLLISEDDEIMIHVEHHRLGHLLHLAFMQTGIPVIAMFDGVHPTHTDDGEKVHVQFVTIQELLPQQEEPSDLPPVATHTPQQIVVH